MSDLKLRVNLMIWLLNLNYTHIFTQSSQKKNNSPYSLIRPLLSSINVFWLCTTSNKERFNFSTLLPGPSDIWGSFRCLFGVGNPIEICKWTSEWASKNYDINFPDQFSSTLGLNIWNWWMELNFHQMIVQLSIWIALWRMKIFHPGLLKTDEVKLAKVYSGTF